MEIKKRHPQQLRHHPENRDYVPNNNRTTEQQNNTRGNTAQMNYRTQLTLKSGNEKTGPIPVSTTTQTTCPLTCAIRDACYAKAGPLAMHWAKVTDGNRGGDFESFLMLVAALPRGQLWRHNQAGDLPGDGTLIDAAALRKLAKANSGRRGFTYTHYDMAIASNRAAVRAANKAGFTVNLSANSLAEVDAAIARKAGPVVCVLPSDVQGKQTLRTPNGAPVVVCPATYRDDVTCASCGLCQSASNTRPVVGFPAHGVSKRRADTIARGNPSAIAA